MQEARGKGEGQKGQKQYHLDPDLESVLPSHAMLGASKTKHAKGLEVA